MADIATQLDFLDVFGGKAGAKAAKKAEETKMKAYDALKGLDTGAMDTAALTQARKNYLDQMGFLKEQSPGAKAAYDAADRAAAEGFERAGENVRHAQEGADKSYAENIAQQAGMAEAEQLAGDQAAELLALKGTLSPEEQAEMVRAGLSATSGSGGVAGSDAQRSGMAKMLITDKLQRQAQRQQMAGNLEAQNANIRAARNANLNSMLGTQAVPASLATQMVGQAGDIVQSRVPAGYGIGGDTAASNYTSNQNLENQKTLGKAGAAVEGINAQYNAGRAATKGTMTAIGGILGGMFGGPMGASAGAGAGNAMTSAGGGGQSATRLA